MYGTVESTELISPSMMRIVFNGDGLTSFTSSEAADQYVNALFVPDTAPYEAPFDVDQARALEPALRPRGRRYTVRRWDTDTRRLTIDFVVHGDVGFAGRWAQRATVGDRLQMTGPSGSYQPNLAAAWHFLAGDESALPAIGAILDTLPTGSHAVVVAVVDGPGYEVPLESRAEVEIHWLHRSTAPTPETLLVDTVSALDWQPGEVDVFVKGEAGEVRAVRKFLLAKRGVDRTTASISPYWRRDHTDEAWREIKRQWLAEQASDI